MNGEPTLGPDTDDGEFDQILVDHAVRCWDAERENAERLSSRSTLLLSALAALFGLGLFRIDWFRGEKDVSRVAAHCVVWTIKILLVFALAMFAFAFWKIMGRRGRQTDDKWPHSSDLLGLPASIVTEGPPVGADARRMVFTKVYRAYTNLQTRNARRKRAVDRSQQLFLFGLGLIALALILYTFASEPPTIYPESRHGQSATKTSP